MSRAQRSPTSSSAWVTPQYCPYSRAATDPQACRLAESSGPTVAATGSIHPNSITLPSGSVSCRWYMKP